jgi:uncharacterized membrane protein YgcG
MGALAFWLTIGVGCARRGLTTRRTPEAAAAARRWQAYRAHLERLEAKGDDPALQGSEAWDQLLTYAVALGLSDEVLRAVATRPGERQPTIGPLRPIGQGLAFSIGSTHPVLGNDAWVGLGPSGAHSGTATYGGMAGGFGGGFTGGGGGAGGGGGGGAW